MVAVPFGAMRTCWRRSSSALADWFMAEEARVLPSIDCSGWLRAFRRRDSSGTRGSAARGRVQASRRDRPMPHATLRREELARAPHRSARRPRGASPRPHPRNWTWCTIRCGRSADHSIVPGLATEKPADPCPETDAPASRQRRSGARARAGYRRPGGCRNSHTMPSFARSRSE